MQMSLVRHHVINPDIMPSPIRTLILATEFGMTSRDDQYSRRKYFELLRIENIEQSADLQRTIQIRIEYNNIENVGH